MFRSNYSLISCSLLILIQACKKEESYISTANTTDRKITTYPFTASRMLDHPSPLTEGIEEKMGQNTDKKQPLISLSIFNLISPTTTPPVEKDHSALNIGEYDLCDTYINRRIVPGFNKSMMLLQKKTDVCTNEIDLIETATTWVCRSLDFGPEDAPGVPDYNTWVSLSLDEKYKYGKDDKAGIWCGHRAEMLKQLLKEKYNYNDFIVVHYNELHSFLLVRLNDGNTWLCDPYMPYGYKTVNGRLDWLSYLYLAKNQPQLVSYYEIPLRFGYPEDLLTTDEVPQLINPLLAKDCNALATIFNTPGVFDSPQWNWSNHEIWMKQSIFLSENTGTYPFKLTGNRSYSEIKIWEDANCIDCNDVNLWTSPNYNIKLSVSEGTDMQWVNQVKYDMESTIDPWFPIEVIN